MDSHLFVRTWKAFERGILLESECWEIFACYWVTQALANDLAS